EGAGEDFEDGPQHAGADPLLKPPVAGLVRRIARWQVRPWSAGPQDPEDPIQHSAVLSPGAPSTVVAPRQLGQEAANHFPLLVREVTAMRRRGVGHPDRVARWLSSLPKLRLPKVRSTPRRHRRLIQSARE